LIPTNKPSTLAGLCLPIVLNNIDLYEHNEYLQLALKTVIESHVQHEAKPLINPNQAINKAHLTGKIDGETNLSLGVDLAQFGDLHNFVELKEYSESLLCSLSNYYCTHKKVCRMFNMADTHCLKRVRKICFDFMVKNYGHIKLVGGYKSLSNANKELLDVEAENRPKQEKSIEDKAIQGILYGMELEKQEKIRQELYLKKLEEERLLEEENKRKRRELQKNREQKTQIKQLGRRDQNGTLVFDSGWTAPLQNQKKRKKARKSKK